jgi:ADP-ribose pyrophosphatase YjhB (NUDIX family)
MPQPQLPKYCRYCGSALTVRAPGDDGAVLFCCSSPECDFMQEPQRGPAVLVLTFIFAEGHILLLRRGIAPYIGCWAPPGGFVEPFESVERAAIRETWEEVGIRLEDKGLIPFAISSLPSINQFYVAFLARLESMLAPTPGAPEALDARWFPERDFPLDDIWEPSSHFDLVPVFDRLRTGRFEFYQRSDRFFRMISDRGQITYLQES